MRSFLRRLGELVEALDTPNLKRLVGAFFLIELGDGIVGIVVPIAVFEATGSAVLTGLTFAVTRGIGIVARPVGGVLADRVERIGILRWTVAMRIVSVVVAVATLPTRPALGLAAVLVGALIGSFDNPATEAAIRVLARHALQEVATVRRIAINFSYLVGPAVGGVAISVGDSRAALIGALAVFAAGMALMAGLRSEVGDRPAAPMGGAVRTALGEAAAGFSHLRRSSDLRVVSAAALVNGLFVSALITTAVVYLARLPGSPDGAFGLAVAGYSTGAVLGLLVAGTIEWQVPLRVLLWRSMVVYGLVCLASVGLPRWEVLALGWLAWGIAFGPEEIVSDVVTVQRSPDHLLGRTYAGLGVLEMGGDAVGAMLGGLAAQFIDPRTVIIAVGLTYLGPIALVFRAAAART